MESREICKSLEELEERRSFWASQPGRVTVRSDDPFSASFGYCSFKERPYGEESEWDEEVVSIIYRPYGELRQLRRLVETRDALAEAYAVHSQHEGRFWRAHDPKARTLGFVCLCEAASGVSHVIQVPLFVAKSMSEVQEAPAPGLEEALRELKKTESVNILEGILKHRRG